MALVWDPLGQQTPGDAEAQPDEDLNGSVHGELQGVGVLVEGDPEEYSKPTDGDHVIRSAGGDHQGGDTLGHTVASLCNADEAGDDDGGRHSGQDKAEHEAD